MKVIVFGGDGFCGWPTSLHLSKLGFEVLIVDNLSRRNIDNELEVDSLTPIRPINDRLKAWHELSGEEIAFKNIDIANDYCDLLHTIKEFNPDTVVHFAEQRAAPYSMKTSWHKRYTVSNNINATHNLMAAIVELGLDIHVVHLGTMGVYGYGTVGMKIPEGYLDVYVEGDDKQKIKSQILYPASPGSIYHMTKTQDQLIFYYYNKNDGVRVTDLHQGVVWGTQTDETALDERLINRFDYDGDYGTVLNRFLMQASVGYPLTVHGSGGQTRAFIHIKDTVKCIELAIQNPPKQGERVKVMNQMTETYKVVDLANIVQSMTDCKVDFISNPRNEDDCNELHVENETLIDMGLEPTLLEEGLLSEISDIAFRYRDRCDLEKIKCTSLWSKDKED